MPRRLVLALTLAALFAPAPAAASTLVNEGNGVLRFTADAGDVNVIDFRNGPNVTVRRLAGDNDPIISVPANCVVSQASVEYLCQSVARIVVDVSGGNDSVDSTALTGVTTVVSGGDGADDLTGGPLTDTLDGGPGTDRLDGLAGADLLSGGSGNDALDGDAGNDAVNGNDGDDDLVGGGGADVLSGGAGIDSALFGTGRASVTVTIDGAPNDGAPNEGDNVLTDVEDVTANADGTGTAAVTGSAGNNVITVDSGVAVITGGPGADTMVGGPLDDMIDARDGYADRIFCGAGNDTVARRPARHGLASRARTLRSPSSPGGPSTIARRRVTWTAPAQRRRFRGNALDDAGGRRDRRPRRGQGPVLRRRPTGVRGHRRALHVRLPGARRRRGPQHIDRDRRRRRRPGHQRRPARHRPPVPADVALAAALSPEPRPPRARTRSAPAAGSRGRGTCALAGLPCTITVTAKRRRHASHRGGDAVSQLRLRLDGAVPLATGEPPALHRAASAATTCWPAARRRSAPSAWARFPGRMEIEGANALVAGGASGLGAATARRLHEAGANVTIADLNPERGSALADELGASFVAADVTDAEQVEAAVDAGRGRGRAADLGLLRRDRLGREGRGQPRPARFRAVRHRDPRQPDRHLQRAAARRGGDARQRARRPGRARRLHQHGLDRRLRRPDRPDRLLGLQGRDRRHDAAGRARPRAVRHPRLRDRPGPVRHAAAGRPPGGGAQRFGRPSAVPAAPRPPGRVCRARRSTSSRTRCSTARSSAWMAPCAWRPDNISSRSVA